MESGDLKTSTPSLYRQDSGFGKCNIFSKHKLVELSPIRKQPLHSNISAILRVCGILSPSKKSSNVPVEKVTKKLMFTSTSDSGYCTDNRDIDSILLAAKQAENDNQTKQLTFSTDENCNIIYDCINSEKLYQPLKYICTEDSNDNELECCKSSNNTSFLGPLFYNDSTDLITEENGSKIDFLKELNIRNCTSILSLILSYLPGKDIKNASDVSKQWQNIVHSDRFAKEKRELYLKNKKNSSIGPNKENKFQSSPLPKKNHKSAFTNVINIKAEVSQAQKHDNFYGRFDSFLEEAKAIREKQSLMKCPKCQYPAKPQSELKFCCTRKLCQHEFCQKCLGPFLKNHVCSLTELDATLPLPKIVIGSKKSKKNLRRL